MVQVAHFFATLSFLLITPSVVNAVSVNVVAPAKGVAISPASELFATVTRRADTDFVAPLPPPFPHADAPKKRGTNSERFARGLSPLKPTRRYTGREFIQTLNILYSYLPLIISSCRSCRPIWSTPNRLPGLHPRSRYCRHHPWLHIQEFPQRRAASVRDRC